MRGEQELIDLTGRVALVTGGSRGVGRATATLLARAGADVGFVYRTRTEDARRTEEEIRKCGARAWSVQADLRDPSVVEGVFSELDEVFGGLDFLIGNHGVWPSEPVPIAEMTVQQWRDTMATNLDSLFFLLKVGTPRLRESGAVVLVSSTAAQRGEAFHGDYAASKGGLQSLVKGLCEELAPRNVRVNAVAPGWIRTEMVEPVFRDGGHDRIRDTIPLKRVADPEDVAGPILFLCSPLARHITGEVLNVNGGAVRPG